MATPAAMPSAVFPNIPYDGHFRRLYLAYIVGLAHLGLHNPERLSESRVAVGA